MAKKDKEKVKPKKEKVFRKLALKKKKKKWYPIYAEKEFSGIQLGELIASSASELIGKIVKLNLGTLTGQAKKQNIRINFKIKEVKEDRPICEIIGYEFVESFVKRAVRKGKSKIDATLFLKTKDNVNIVIKVLVITRNKVQSGITGDMRKKINEFFSDACTKLNYEDFVKGLINEDLHNDLRKIMNKIYPVSVTKVRFFLRK